MWSRIRRVMMWCLIAALPVQSWAIATMVNCGPSHHRMALQAVDAPAAAHESHDHDLHHGGHDAASHHHDLDAAEAHADHDEPGTEQPPLSMSKFKCSACATCCLGMGLPSTVLTFDASVSSETVTPGMPQGHVVFLTTGLERPPRTILA